MSPDDTEMFYLHKRIVVKDLPIFEKVCMQYMFKIPLPGETYSSLIFSRKELIFELNFETEESSVIYKYSKPFST